MCVPVRVVLTLNDVGHHEGGAGVVADETTARQVAFDLQGEQIPAERRERLRGQCTLYKL